MAEVDVNENKGVLAGRSDPAGKNIVVGQVHLRVDSISIDNTETREYVEAEADGDSRLAYA
jgi:hypothetical protein